MVQIDMIFFGASGHAKVVIEAWTASGGRVTQLLDDNHTIKELLGIPVKSTYQTEQLKDQSMIISIGSNTVRKKVAERLQAKYQSVIHPSAILSPTARLGAGTAVMAGVTVNASTTVGDHVILNTGSVVEHDCLIGDFVHISPHATLCGNVQVGEGTHVGAGATIIQGIKVGQWATIGAGAVIIEDVPDRAVVVGVPGKIIKFDKP
jgi:acetyltransferase EpsM